MTKFIKNQGLADLGLDFIPEQKKGPAATPPEANPHEVASTTTAAAGPEVEVVPSDSGGSKRPPQNPVRKPASKLRKKTQRKNGESTRTAAPDRNMDFVDRQKTVHFDPEVYDAVCDLEYELRKQHQRIPRGARPAAPNRSAIVNAAVKAAMENPKRVRELLGF